MTTEFSRGCRRACLTALLMAPFAPGVVEAREQSLPTRPEVRAYGQPLDRTPVHRFGVAPEARPQEPAIRPRDGGPGLRPLDPQQLTLLTVPGPVRTGESIRHDVAVGDITMQVSGVVGGIVPAGSSVFAEIRLLSLAARLSDVEVEITPSGAAIVGVHGRDSTQRGGPGSTRVVKIAGLRRGRGETIIVELAPGSVGASAGRAGLRVVLAAGGNRRSGPAELSWRIADCSASYHKTLTAIAAEPRQQNALKMVRTADERLPGRWLNAALPAASGRAGRGLAVSPAGAEELAVHREADELVKSRGLVADLQAGGRFGWVTTRVGDDLWSYMRQPPHPALCTGVADMLDFFDTSLAGLSKRIDEASVLAERALSQAAARVAALRSAAPVARAALSAGGDQVEPALLYLTRELARVAGGDAALASLAGVTDPLMVLVRLGESGPTQAGVPADLQRPLAAAFRAAEAAAYLARADSHFKAVRDATFGRMSAVRDAHARHCACGN